MKYRTVQQFIITATTIAICSACDKEMNDRSLNAPVAAEFTSEIYQTQTRASGTSWALGDKIGISAVSTGKTSYENILYRVEDTNGRFEVVNTPGKDNTIYFQDENPVTFTAYYPYTGQNGSSPGILTYTLTAADQTPQRQPLIDFLFATATGRADAPGITFSFSHCMSRLILNFLPGIDLNQLSDITYTISNLNMEGTFNTATGEAKVVNNTTADLTLNIPLANDMTSPLILFPQQTDTPLRLKVEMNGLIYEATFLPDPDGKPIQPGYSYVCNVKLNKQAVTIEPASILPWDSGGNRNVEATN